MRKAPVLAAVLFTLALPATASAAVIQSNALPSGTTVDLTNLTTGVSLSGSDPIFGAAGIASISVTDDPSTNDEFYDGGSFGAGRALFNTEDGDLIALDEGASVDFGSPTFTIDFTDTVDAFGLRFADTSSSFATPQLEFFRDGSSIDSILINDSFDASTEFGFSATAGFDGVAIDVDTVGSGFGFDGVGITSLTVGNPVNSTPIPVPATTWMMVLGLIGLAVGIIGRSRGSC
jgi:hypothetical protein